MGREVRMVPPNWEHPKDADGRFIPLRDSYRRAVDFMEEHPDLYDGDDAECQPDPADFMPDFGDSATHLMMYEDCSEGTPISPSFATPEELARWLADNGASAFGSMTASYEAWISTIKRGWAPSAVMTDGVIRSGVEDLNQKPPPADSERQDTTDTPALSERVNRDSRKDEK